MLDMLMIGVGAHGRSILRMNMESPVVRFTAIADRDEARLREAGEEFGIARRCTDANEAMEQSGVQAVYVAAASPAHYGLVKAALDRGLHVLVEKPFVLGLTEADELISLAEQEALTLSVNQNYRFIDVVMRLKEAIDAGIAGAVQYACADFFLYYEGHPYQRAMDDFMLFEMAVHHVDLCRYLLRSDIAAVDARAWNVKGSIYHGDPSVHAVYDMACGIPVFYTGSLVSKGYGSHWPGRWRIQCEHGSLHLDDLGQGYGAYLCIDDKLEKLVSDGPFVESSMLSLADFTAAVEQRRSSSVSGAGNRNTIAALIATSVSTKRKTGSIRILLEFIACQI